MKAFNVTKNKTINVPDEFTMGDLQRVNPESKINTLYQRVCNLVDNGHVIEDGEQKSTKTNETGEPVKTRGRASIIYKLVNKTADVTSIRVKFNNTPIENPIQTGQVIPEPSVPTVEVTDTANEVTV